MPRLLVHVEGQTEEDFVKMVLAPHLRDSGYSTVSARLLGNARQRIRRDGIRPWDTVRRDILGHLKGDRAALATTMVDYYGLHKTWPGRTRASRQATIFERAATVQQAILKDISKSIECRERFVPYVVMHEFEGLLFSDPDRFAESLGRPVLAADFRAIREDFSTPEDINDSPHTAPSKRITRLYAKYQKPLMGTQAMELIGLGKVREACPLFNQWIVNLEQRARPHG